MAEFMGARIVVLSALSSNRWLIDAKSRVKPAKMLMLRSLPSTSERITVSESAGVEVEGESAEPGIAGPRFSPAMGRWFWLDTVTTSVAASK